MLDISILKANLWLETLINQGGDRIFIWVGVGIPNIIFCLLKKMLLLMKINNI